MAVEAGITKDRIRLAGQTSYADAPPAGYIDLVFDNITGSYIPMFMLPGDLTPRSFGSNNHITLFEGVPTSGEWNIATNTADALLCTHLEGRLMLRSTVAAAAFDLMYFLFNGDTLATNYRRAGNTTTEAAANSPAGGNTPTGALSSGGTSTALEYAMVNFQINYFRNNAAFKLVTWQSTVHFNAGASTQTSTGGVYWANTAAITSLLIRMDGHPTDVINAASRLHLVGIKI